MAKYELVVTSDDALSSPLTLTVLNSVGPRGPAGPAGPTGPAGATTFGDLTDVDSSGATAGQLLQADGDDTFSFVTVAGATNTLDDVTDNGNTTTNSISVGGITATSLNTHTIPGGTGTLALTSDVPTVDLDDVTTNGNTTTNAISVGGITATSLNTHTIPSGTGTLAKTSDIPTNNNQLTNGAGYITDYTVTQGDVTAHQAALSITESQISDLGTYLTAETNDLSSTVTWANVPDANITESSVTQHQAALSITESQISDFGTYIPTSQKGAASGVASLDSSGLVPTSQLPSYVDDVLEYTNYSSFPGTGETGKIYVDLATGDIYRWSGSAYVQINDAVSSADQATQLATARTISLGGDVSGSTSFDGTADVTITATVADDSHNHVISNVDGLQSALDAKINTADLADTDDLTEGTTNLYYTDARSRQAISLSSSSSELSYNNTTGVFSYTSPTTVAETNAVTIEVRNTTGSTIAKGVPVYVSGHSGTDILVAPADADDANKMPAIGLMSAALNNNSNGTVTSIGLITGIDLSSFSVGDVLYVDTTPGGSTFGGLTNTKPTGESSKVQNLGKVARATSNGEFIISGPGRSNDTPNLDDGDIFIGNASNQAVTSSLSTEVSSIVGSLSLNADNIDSGTLASARLPDLTVADFAGSAIITEAEGLSNNDNDTSIPTAAAVIDYVDGTGSVANDATITIAAGTGLSNGGDFTTNQGAAETITINHSNSVTAGTVSEGGAARTLSYGGSFNVPSVTYDAQGHITGTTTTALQLPASDNTDTVPNDSAITISSSSDKGIVVTNGGFTLDQSSGQTVTLEADLGDLRTKIGDDTTSSIGQITIRPTGVTNDPAGQLRLQCEDSAADTHLFTLEGPAHSGFGGAYTWKVPQSQGTAGQGIKIDSISGVVASLDYFDIPADTDDITEGTNLYYTDARANSAFDTRLATKDTDDLSEGTTNLYYTDARVNSAFDTRLATKTTTNLSEGTNLYYTDARADARVNLQTGTNLDLSNQSTTDLSEGTNLYYTDARADARVAAATGVNLSLTNQDTDDLSEGATNLYFTNARAQSAITVTDAGGDGSLGYSGGTITYTGPSAAETRAHFSGGTGVTITNGSVAIGQDVGTSDNVSFNDLTLAGNLTVNGSTTTVDTTNLTVSDSLIELSSGASTAANDAGLVIERGSTGDNAFIGWDESADKFTVGTTTATGISTGNLTITTGTLVANIEGNVTGNVTGTVSDVSNHDTDDISEGSTNLYYTDARANSAFDTRLALKDTGDLSEGTNLYYTDARADARVNLQTGANLNLSSKDTDDLSEGTTNLYHTTARARGAVSVTDAGGDGSLAYNSTSGVITYTGPSAAETRAHFSVSGDLSYDSGTGAFSFTERTDAEVRGLISVTDAGGDGSLAYNNSTGVLTYTGASDTVKTGDTDASSYSFVVDEDDMASNSATKVPTQQSVKAYADTKASTGKAIAMAIVFGG